MDAKVVATKLPRLEKEDSASDFFASGVTEAVGDYMVAYNSYVPVQGTDIFSTYKSAWGKDGITDVFVMFYRGRLLGIRGDYDPEVLKSVKFADLLNKATPKYGKPIKSGTERHPGGYDKPPSDADLAYWQDGETTIALVGMVIRVGNSSYYQEIPSYSINFLDRSMLNFSA